MNQKHARIESYLLKGIKTLLSFNLVRVYGDTRLNFIMGFD